MDLLIISYTYICIYIYTETQGSELVPGLYYIFFYPYVYLCSNGLNMSKEYRVNVDRPWPDDDSIPPEERGVPNI